VFLHGKNDYVKKTKKGDIVTRFWYTLKNVDHARRIINGSFNRPKNLFTLKVQRVIYER
jgi:hypothetical protein